MTDNNNNNSNLRVGDLCRPHNCLSTGEIIVGDEHLESELFCLERDDLVLIVEDVRLTGTHVRQIRTLLEVIRRRIDPASVTVHQILVSCGSLAGRVGYVPSFWITRVYRPPL